MSHDHVRNVQGLLLYAEAKSRSVRQRVDSAIRSLVSQHKAVNFNSVAAQAGVSKTTLYNNPEYRTRIELLRQNSISAKIPTKRIVTDKGKDVILAAKNKRINELEAEVKRLSAILKHCYADEYDKY